MILNLDTLRSELSNRLKNSAISVSRRDRWLNLSQDEIAISMDPDHLITLTTFTAVANQRSYNLDVEFNKVLSVRDTTNDIDLTQVSESEIEEFDPDFGDT